MKARTGKIARLPREIRDKLNHRLHNGEPGKQIVTWLNSLPEVQKVLAAEFESQPIRQQNLSEWRKGGHREWLQEQEALKVIAEMMSESEQLQAQLGSSVTDKLTGWLIPHYVLAARAQLAAAKTSEEHWKVLRTVCSDLVALRRGDHYVERLRLEGERLEATKQLTQEKKDLEFEEWLKRPDIQERIRPRRKRELVLRRVQNIIDHFMVGTPLEDFEYVDDEELPDPAAMI